MDKNIASPFELSLEQELPELEMLPDTQSASAPAGQNCMSSLATVSTPAGSISTASTAV